MVNCDNFIFDGGCQAEKDIWKKCSLITFFTYCIEYSWEKE